MRKSMGPSVKEDDNLRDASKKVYCFTVFGYGLITGVYPHATWALMAIAVISKRLKLTVERSQSMGRRES